MERAEFEHLVAETAYRPSTPEALLPELEGQLLYLPEPRREALGELAAGLAAVFSIGAEEALPLLASLAREHPEQPLCHFYLLAACREARDATGAREALAALARADAEDPMVELLRLNLEGQPIAGISEEVRLANIAKFAGTPLLRNPYRLAVGAIFEAIREREHVRVLDVGIGSGAQMSELLGLLGREENRVRRLEIIGLDLVADFLETAGENLSLRAAELGGRMEVVYRPVEGRVDALDDESADRIRQGGPLDAANATIALHEVPGEAKVSALRNVRRLAPRRFVLAEWNYCLENVLPETSVEFLFNVRRVTAAMVAALREQHPLSEARAVVRDWLSLAGGQLTCAASERQECFLDVASWKALLERSGFTITPPDQALLRYAEGTGEPTIEGSYVATPRYAHGTPIALIEATCG